jgi:hypothetical protein
VSEKLRDVGPTRTKGRKFDGHAAKSRGKVCAESSLSHQRGERTLSCSHDSGIDRDGSRFAQWNYLLQLEGTQELRLNLKAKLADFVQEQRAALSRSKLPDVRFFRAGKCTASVPKKLTFSKSDRNGGAVQCVKRTIPRAELVKCPRNDLLTHARFTDDLHWQV